MVSYNSTGDYMDQKLRNLERTREFLRYHRYACIAAALVIIGMCVHGAIKHPGSIQENIGITVLGLGCCIFSALSGANMRKKVDLKIEQVKARLSEPADTNNSTD